MVSLIRYALFREADVDGSGEVTFDEFQLVVRKKLNHATAEMPGARLRALWCALDADDSNAIRVDEFAKLLKRYAPPQNSKPKFGGKGSVRGQAFDAFQAPLQARGTALASPSTAAMRAELEAAQVELPEAAALVQLSRLFGGRLEEFCHRIGSSRGRDTHATTKANPWYQLFARVDVDGSTAARLEARPLARAAPLISHDFELSPKVDTPLASAGGFVTFNELQDATRTKLRVSKAELSQGQLKALWCVLDADDSDAVQVCASEGR
jgi:hypothetical protein